MTSLLRVMKPYKVLFQTFGLEWDIGENKGVDVGVFVDDFAYGFAASVSGFLVDAYQFGRIAGVGSLERSGIFE